MGAGLEKEAGGDLSRLRQVKWACFSADATFFGLFLSPLLGGDPAPPPALRQRGQSPRSVLDPSRQPEEREAESPGDAALVTRRRRRWIPGSLREAIWLLGESGLGSGGEERAPSVFLPTAVTHLDGSC